MRKNEGRTKAYHSGSAALCAVLIMIMLIAIGTCVLVVTGRRSIDENQDMPAHNVFDTSSEESAPAEPIPEEVKPLIEYPEKDFDFMKMQIESVTAKNCVVLDCTNNKIYTGKSYNKKAYPASLTKIMTIIVALENCDDLNATYKFTKADMKALADENASVAGFVAGEKVTIKDLLYGAILPSGADATLGLANYIAGSEAAFVDMMNAKVEELGLTGTHFTNASGLHDKDHYSTAIDMALIVKYALDNKDIADDFISVLSATEYRTKNSNKNPDGIVLSSIFFERYDGFFIDRDQDEKADVTIVGGKTGFTDESGYSLASLYKLDDGTYYVCITMNSASSGDATKDNVAIVEKYLPAYDLIGETSSVDSTSSINNEISTIDVTPSVIDQTESSSSASDPNLPATIIPDQTSSTSTEGATQ